MIQRTSKRNLKLLMIVSEEALMNISMSKHLINHSNNKIETKQNKKGNLKKKKKKNK